ncbi:MAG: hypothetical protein Q8K78_04845 [Planctomycetaceae bacterium]|nr:hypothetical protein [Planctomycetaceae bacterium]
MSETLPPSSRGRKTVPAEQSGTDHLPRGSKEVQRELHTLRGRLNASKQSTPLITESSRKTTNTVGYGGVLLHRGIPRRVLAVPPHVALRPDQYPSPSLTPQTLASHMPMFVFADTESELLVGPEPDRETAWGWVPSASVCEVTTRRVVRSADGTIEAFLVGETPESLKLVGWDGQIRPADPPSHDRGVLGYQPSEIHRALGATVELVGFLESRRLPPASESALLRDFQRENTTDLVPSEAIRHLLRDYHGADWNFVARGEWRERVQGLLPELRETIRRLVDLSEQVNGNGADGGPSE